MIKIGYIFAVALISFGSLQAQENNMLVDKIVGVVADDIIIFSDVEIQYQQYKAKGEVTDDMRCELFDQLLMDKLFLAQAIIDSVFVSEDEVESELDRRIRYFIGMFGSKEKLEEYYGKSIIELKDEFRKNIYDQLQADKMRRQIFSDLAVTPAEVKSFYKSIPKDSLPYFNTEVELAHLVIYPEVSEEQKEYAYQKIVDIRKNIIENGSDFATQAIIYSEDPGSAADGGNLGYIERGEMVRPFEAAAFRLKEGEISDIVETKFGYHIIQVDQKKGERIKARHILIRTKVTSFELEAARKLADSVYHLISSDSMKFRKAVAAFSDDEQTKDNQGLLTNPNTGTAWFEMSEVEGTIAFLLEDLKVGQVSRPSTYTTPDEKQGYRIVYLKSETEPHQADLKKDYEKIRGAALQKKQQERLVNWVAEKSKETYIFIDDAFLDCTNIQKWIVKR